jgi:hypothetical protein
MVGAHAIKAAVMAANPDFGGNPVLLLGGYYFIL